MSYDDLTIKCEWKNQNIEAHTTDTHSSDHDSSSCMKILADAIKTQSKEESLLKCEPFIQQEHSNIMKEMVTKEKKRHHVDSGHTTSVTHT